MGQAWGLRVLVETGTYRGGMLAAVRGSFDTLHSIELNGLFYLYTKRRFAFDSAVHLWHGDSAAVLPQVLAEIDEPALFWLDAHGGQAALLEDGSFATAPVVAEVRALLQHQWAGEHVILIDDAHTLRAGLRWGAGVWRELEELRREWRRRWPEGEWTVQDTILRIHPRTRGQRA